MRFNFTKKQYNSLLEMCLIGAFVIENSKIDVDDEYSEILKYIIEFDDKLYHISIEDGFDRIKNLASILMENVNLREEFLSQYNERVFWKELSCRLAAKEALNEIGDNINDENYSKYVSIKNKYEKKYFEKFDIDKCISMELPY